ncbi:MAG: long-chain acyl-CoA synthetase, partial [Sulfitobacter sp.]
MITINPPTPSSMPTNTIVEAVRANALAHPAKLALVCDGQQVTWGAFNTRINKIANLVLSMGVQKGDNIAIISPNSIPYAELFMGILRAGACVTPLSTMA